MNERYLGQFKWGDTSLTFANPRMPADLSKAQASLATADDHYKRASRAALQNPAKTTKFVLSAMRELEKGMTRRESAYEEAASKSKPP